VTPLGSYINPPAVPVPLPGGETFLSGRPALRTRGLIVLTPTLTVSEEYNDNVFLANRSRKSDFITAVAPGLSLTLEGPRHRLSGSYSFTSLLYARESELDTVRGRELLTLDALYRATPRLTLTLSDLYVRAESSNVGSVEGFSTGLTTTTSNTLSPGASYAIDLRTTLRTFGSWTKQTFETESQNSETYRAEADVDHRLSPRLTLTAGYAFARFDVQGSPPVSTHTPEVGASYRITAALTATVLAGPQVIVQGGDLSLKPFARGDIVQRFAWGIAGLTFSHAEGTTGALGTIAATETISGQLQVTKLVRGLVLALTPHYTRAASGGNGTDVQAFNIGVQASYQLAPWLTAVAGYSFFDQRTNGVSTAASASSTNGTRVDQNRILLGLQFGYPVRFE
jgi:hypothetical protein